MHITCTCTIPVQKIQLFSHEVEVFIQLLWYRRRKDYSPIVYQIFSTVAIVFVPSVKHCVVIDCNFSCFSFPKKFDMHHAIQV